ncbi:MAG: M20/M25/M40 family metallo-hydrolase [Methanobacterium sp.]
MQEVTEYVDKNLNAFIDDLKKICKIPSVSAQNEGIEETASKIVQIMQESGIESKLLRIEGANPLVYGEFKPKRFEKTIIFYNHYDVQPADPLDQWESPPFKPTIRDGKLFARGVADNKGNIIARVKAVESILKVKEELPVAVKFIFEGEEEIGGVSLPKYVDKYGELFKADMGIWESGDRHETERPTIKLGYKGIAYYDISVKGPNKDVHSGRAGLIKNPIWRLMEFLSSLRDKNGKILIEGFYDDIDQIKEEDLELLNQIPFDDNLILKKYGLTEFESGCYGVDALKALYLKPTCNIDGIYGGYEGASSKTIVPSIASAKLDFRFLPGQKPENLFYNLQKHVKKYGFEDIDINYLYGYESAKTPASSVEAEIVKDATRKTYNKEPLIYPLSIGSSPIYNFINKMNIPTVSVGVEYWGSLVHSPNENIRLEDFKMGIKNIINIVDTFAKKG